MFYREFKPASPLQPYIKCYWILEDPLNTACDVERIVPDGRMELIFHYGDPFQRIVDGTAVTQSRGIVAGQVTAPILLKPTGAVGMVGVRFYPHGFASLFSIPATELSEGLFDARDVMDSSWKDCEDWILEAASHAEKIKILDAFFLARKNSEGSFDFRVGKAARKIKEQNGLFDLKSLASELNLGPRQVERLFKQKVGLGLNQFARIARFQFAISTKLGNLNLSLTDLSHTAGYYDQAHLVRDFKSFSGLSPRRYFSDVHRMGDLFADDV